MGGCKPTIVVYRSVNKFVELRDVIITFVRWKGNLHGGSFHGGFESTSFKIK